MARRLSGDPESGARLPSLEDVEQTDELTGFDASMDESEIGSAGNGAAPFGADASGGPPLQPESDPGTPADILPDEIERLEWMAQADEDGDISVRPDEPPSVEVEAYLSELP